MTVSESEIESRPRGALVGIPGAPSALPAGSPDGQPWTVCDTVTADGTGSVTTTVVVGEPSWSDRVGPLGSDRALLVSHGADTYLVYDGRRAPIDLRDRAVTRALGLESAQPRPIGRGLLNAIPETLPITPPQIESRGSAPNYQIAGRDRRIRRQTDARRRRPLTTWFSGTECRRSVPPQHFSSSSPIPGAVGNGDDQPPTRWPGLLWRTCSTCRPSQLSRRGSRTRLPTRSAA